MADDVMVAVVAAVASFVVAGWTAYSQKRSEGRAAANQERITRLESGLQGDRDERDAQRDYQYDARKRMYAEVQPVLMQVADSCEASFFRIENLVLAANKGHLGSGKASWIAHDRYYLNSTLYRILRPLAYFTILQRKTTRLDFELDEKIKLHYLLLKEMYYTYSRSWAIAEDFSPKLPYDPLNENWSELRKSNPAIYWEQGLPIGILDNAANVMINEKGEAKEPAVISFGEFELRLRDKTSALAKTMADVFDRFRGFHPAERPVLWRILCVNACLDFLVVQASRGALESADSEAIVTAVRAVCDDPRCHRKFAWQNPGETAESAVARARETFGVARDYIVRSLRYRDLLD